jgi:hypothetical protein
MSVSICNFCNKGDTGTITAVRESKDDAPDSWFVVLDGGCDSYIFDGEFEVVGGTAKTSLGFPTPTHVMRWSEPWKASLTQKPI